VKFFQADGGEDVQAALDLSGEPLVIGAFVGKPSTKISVYENWKLNSARTAFAAAYLDRWNETKNATNTGRPIDAILSPVYAFPSYTHESELSIGYTGIVNLVQLTSVIIPVTHVDESDETFGGCPVGLQLICRRLEEEKALGLAMIFAKELQ
jgi:amidase